MCYCCNHGLCLTFDVLHGAVFATTDLILAFAFVLAFAIAVPLALNLAYDLDFTLAVALALDLAFGLAFDHAFMLQSWSLPHI